MTKYKTLVKMSQNNVYVVQTRFILNLLCDFHILLGLFCLLPLLKEVNAFTHGRDIFIYDFVEVVKMCQTYFYMMY
jgi:hypothetical protein